MLGEIRLFAGDFAPENWSLCDGSVLQIAQNSELFSLIGTQFGGDGTSTYALPKIDSLPTTGPGATPVHYIICTWGYYPQRP